MLTFQDLIILLPSLVAISFILFAYPFLYYIWARLFVKVWPKAALRAWAMSGVNLKSMPSYCPYKCDGSCRNWTCPNIVD